MRTLYRLLDEAMGDPLTAAAVWLVAIVLTVAGAFAFACAALSGAGRP